MNKVLTIAGSDCSGGAGIQADIKTMTVHGCYAMSVITALTAQNTTGVYGILEASPGFVAQQLDCVFTDIRPDAVKIGMVSNAGIIEIIAQKLLEYKAGNIVVDPVMVSTSGSKLLGDDAVNAVITRLFPIADIITPNIPEAEALSGLNADTPEGMLACARSIAPNCKGWVLVKGGHMDNAADDLLYKDGEALWLKGRRVGNPNTHGTGCTLSSAIACNLAGGMDIPQSVEAAKRFVTGALEAGLDLGRGSGPLNHMYNTHIL